MHFTWADWAVVAAYFVLSSVVGLAFGRRAGKSAAEYFTAGRALPWWLAGTSMVATTFAADTPLAVTGLVAAHGLSGNWVWWNLVAGNMLTVFFFARLWRRAGVQTDAELAELRYSGRPAAALRVFRALYLAIPVNLIILGWVNLAMVKVLEATLGVRPVEAMLGLFVLTVAYSVVSGLWGVVTTDFFQFLLAMVGSIVLAVVAVDAVGGLDVLLARLPERWGSTDAALGLFPSDASWMPLTAFLTFLAVQWWATWYPGSEPGGGGYVAQRIFASKTERDGQLATLWFTIAHYAVRPWPWILTALAACLLYPGLADPGVGYAKAFTLLPSGLKGLMLAAFAAAYMSTISSQLNWGGSYLAGDLYVRFARTKRTDRQVVRASRLATVLLFVASAGSTWLLAKLGSVDRAWQLLLALGAGTGPVYLLRWYWWRINAWSELAAMAVSLGSFAVLTGAGVFDPADSLGSAYLMLANTAITTLGWVVVTLVTKPEPDATLQAFVRRVHPGGPGWRAVTRAAGLRERPIADGARSVVAWACGVVAVYAALFGVGKLLLGPRLLGAGLLALAGLAFGAVLVSLRQEARGEAPEGHAASPVPAVAPVEAPRD
ncbi:MAG: sodium:solute symporter family protein [Myxococcota bacterium]